MQNREIREFGDVNVYVHSVVFMPGWTFTVLPLSWDQATFQLSAAMSVRDSDDAPKYETVMGDFYEYVTVKLSNVPTTDHLARVMIDLAKTLIDRTWEHEAREFFRVRSDRDTGIVALDYPAPFHPHRPTETDERWEAAAS